MVAIAKTFNDDMQDYLDKLYGKKERFSDVKKKKKAEKIVHERVPEQVTEQEIFVEYDEVKPGFRDWFAGLFRRRIPSEEDLQDDLPAEKVQELETMEDELEEVETEIETLEEKREGLLERFLNLMRGSRAKRRKEDAEELLEEVQTVIDEDVKETLKALHKWLERLPNRDMREFKVSDDFQKYKLVLEKYGLIKK